MIKEYHRPKSLEEALGLLDRPTPLTLPLGGGTYLSQHAPPGVALVDLVDLDLSNLSVVEGELIAGAMVTLSSLEKFTGLPIEIRRVIAYESTGNMRNRITIGGTLLMAKAHSPLLTSLLALSASTIWLPGEVFVSLDELLREHPVRKFGLLIKEMRFLLPQKFVFHSISNTPFSELDICVAGASWTCGQTRVAATVHSSTRPEVIIDEKSESISEALINNACSQYLQPKKPTEYQNKTTKILITRTILELK